MNTKSIVLLLLAPLALSTESVVAQSVPDAAVAKPVVGRAVVSLNFAGGTLAEFVDAVRKDQSRANIVLATEARDAQVPAIVLKSAGLEQALEGACMAAAADYDVRVKEFWRGTGEPVYSITAMFPPTNTQYSQQMSRRRSDADVEQKQVVFSTASLTIQRQKGMKPLAVATILSTIELAMADEQKAPRIRFHEDSGLLLVRGSRAQIVVAEQVLRTLEKDLDSREGRLRRERVERATQANINKGQPSK